MEDEKLSEEPNAGLGHDPVRLLARPAWTQLTVCRVFWTWAVAAALDRK